MSEFEHKQTVEVLERSEERFRKLIEQAPIAMAVVGMDGAIELINQRAITVFGYLLDDIPTMDSWWVKAYPEENYRAEVIADWTERVLKAISDRQDIIGNEYKVTCKDGALKTVFISGTPVAGKIFVLFDDITARKRAEERLRKSEERYRRLVETTDTGYVIIDSGGVVLDANPAYVRLSGHNALADILGRSVVEWTAEEEREANARAVANCVERGLVRNLEITYVDKLGKRTPVEINATLIEAEGQLQILALCRDISERRRAENLLAIQHTLAYELNMAQSIESWLALCLDAALGASGMDCGGIYLADNGDESFVLAVYQGLSREMALSVSRIEPNSPDAQLVLAGQPMYATISALSVSFNVADRISGLRAVAVIPVSYEGRIIGCFNLGSRGSDSVPSFARTALETIAAQIGTGIAKLRTEIALRQSNEKFLKIFKTSPDAITITRLSDGTCLDVNPSFAEATGYAPEEVCFAI